LSAAATVVYGSWMFMMLLLLNARVQPTRTYEQVLGTDAGSCNFTNLETWAWKFKPALHDDCLDLASLILM
jgi:hypothetical protein